MQRTMLLINGKPIDTNNFPIREKLLVRATLATSSFGKLLGMNKYCSFYDRSEVAYVAGKRSAPPIPLYRP